MALLALLRKDNWKAHVVKGQVSWDRSARCSHPLYGMQIGHAIGIVMQKYTELDRFV